MTFCSLAYARKRQAFSPIAPAIGAGKPCNTGPQQHEMKMWEDIRTLYNPLNPSFCQVCFRQSIGPLNRVVFASTWDCNLTFVRSNGYSKTLEVIPAILYE